MRSPDTVADITNAVSRAWRSGGFPPADRIVLGLTAAPGHGSDARRLCEAVSATVDASEVWLADDTVTAHCGALSGGPGICLIVGTGVACLSVSDRGSPRTYDGHGYLLGDNGGAYWIGRRALRGALREHDLRTPGALANLARKRYGSLDMLHIRIHESESPANTIAQFARDVLEAASTCLAADRIIKEAAAQLFGTIEDALAASDRDVIPLALGGRMLGEATALRAALDELIGSDARLAPRSADGSPLDGALRLGSSETPEPYRDLVHVWKEPKAA